MRCFKKWISERSQIKSGAANKNRNIAAIFDLADFAVRVLCPIGGRVIHIRRNIINQMMRHTALFFVAWFGGRDFDSLIDLHGIAIYYFSVSEPKRERDADLGFARSGRSDD